MFVHLYQIYDLNQIANRINFIKMILNNGSILNTEN